MSDASAVEWFPLVLGREYVSLVFPDDWELVTCWTVKARQFQDRLKLAVTVLVEPWCNR